MTDAHINGPVQRDLRRIVGPVAWAVFADLMDDTEQGDGSCVARTSVRRLANNLGIGKDTAARALTRLAASGLIERMEQQHDANGRFSIVGYRIRVETRPVDSLRPAPSLEQRARVVRDVVE